VGRIAGIELRVHATFLLLLAYAALSYYRLSGSGAMAIRGVIFTLALFASVVLHELGHALAGRRFGVATRDITLLPIGGVARLAYIPRQPKQELLIALAGPAVTLGIILVLFGIIQIFGLPNAYLSGMFGARSGLVGQLMWANIFLLVFNLLPAFPMDGGRIMRSALALRTDYLTATRAAAGAGRAFALLFGIIGLMYDPFLVLIALFVWLGAAGEAAQAQLHSTLAGVSVERVMVRNVQTLTPRDTLGAALDHVLAGFQHDFPVIDDGDLVGVLTRSMLVNGLARHGQDVLVDEVMERTFRTADPTEPVEDALVRLRGSDCRTLPVISDHRLQGLLTLDNVGEFVMIDAALRGATQAA
jgi:Zn-dependent protease/CBS domain-containing protein